MRVWEKIYQAVTNRIREEDRAFELAYLRFGEARRWLVEQADLSPHWLVLEVGYGQGYLTMELASALKTGKVVGIDLLHEDSTIGVTRWIADKIGLRERIALVTSDSTKLPFREATFHTVVSFLALHDIKSTRENEGVLATVSEACRVLKKSGTLALADDSFLRCRPRGDQGKLFKAMKRHWHNLLPSTREVIKQMEKNGISEAKLLSHDPKESLSPRDAERELRLSVEWAKPLGVKVDFENFWREARRIVKSGGRVFSKVVLLLGTKG